jgi:hypothetical protein
VRARLEAEDAQRVLLGALNGLAGLMLLDGQRAEAVTTFREVLAIGAGSCWRRSYSRSYPFQQGAKRIAPTCFLPLTGGTCCLESALS